jgi:hypothetical protein
MINLRGHHLRIFHGYMTAHDSKESLDLKKRAIMNRAKEDGHSEEQALHIIKILEKAMKPDEKIRITETLDDICATCNSRNKRVCREFIPYDASATCEDRNYLQFYGLQKKEYSAKFIRKRLFERGRF